MKALGLLLEKQADNDKLYALWLQDQSNLATAMRLSRIEEVKNNIKILEQQKINKFLNSLIKLFTLGTVNINNKIEIKISKWNEVLEAQLKKAKEFEKLEASPSLFSRLWREVFDKQSINNEVVNLSSKSGVKSISSQI